jgi:hypothetical protein
VKFQLLLSKFSTFCFQNATFAFNFSFDGRYAEVNPDRRPTAEALTRHPWMRRVVNTRPAGTSPSFNQCSTGRLN